VIVLQSPSQGSSRVRGIAIRARLGNVDSFEVTDVRNRLSQALEEVGPVANPLVGEPGLRISGHQTTISPSTSLALLGSAPFPQPSCTFHEAAAQNTR
jgi:hypothetical protein